ncbi:hypothetical protein Scep_015904 [Stephania cephalantha]|uniref:Uncharacterized protein n=1 Tax=Stephania cephalantha TaxID=152367 RepID=A0AAP0INA5_9MAGN
MNSRIHTQLREECLDAMAYAAGALAEDHHRPLPLHLVHSLHCFGITAAGLGALFSIDDR